MTDLRWRHHQHAVARAMLAVMLLVAVWPAFARVLAAGRAAPEAAAAQWVEICTSAGLHWVRLPVASNDSADAGSNQPDPSAALDVCPLCTLPIDRSLVACAALLPSALGLAFVPAIHAANHDRPALDRMAWARGPPGGFF